MTASITFDRLPKGRDRAADIGRNLYRKVSIDGVHVLNLQNEASHKSNFYKAWHIKNLEDEPQTPFWIRRLKLGGQDYFTLDEARRRIVQEIQRAIAAGEHKQDFDEHEHRLRIEQSELERQQKALREQLDAVETRLGKLAWLD